MTPAPAPVSAVFHVRVWVDGGKLVRGRIIESLDLVDRRDEVVLAVGSAAEIEQCIHDWLERLSRAPVTAR